MSDHNLHQLSRRERQIMDLIFEHGEISAKAVTELMPEAPTYTTVRSLLRILEEKGFVSHRKESRQFLYRATVSAERLSHNRLTHVLKTFFKGSLTDAVATFINHPESSLSKEELEELSSIIDAAKRKESNT